MTINIDLNYYGPKDAFLEAMEEATNVRRVNTSAPLTIELTSVKLKRSFKGEDYSSFWRHTFKVVEC